MRKNKRSPLAIDTICSIYEQMRLLAVNQKLISVEVGNTSYSREQTAVSSMRLRAPIVITDPAIKQFCTPAEWWLIGDILNELKEFNALWSSQAHPPTSHFRKTLKGLITKEFLLKTETVGIYIVNPRYIRRGDPFAVAMTTASMLVSRPPSLDMIKDKVPVRNFNLNVIYMERLDTPPEP